LNGKLISYDFQIICVPLQFNNEPYTLVNLVDISSSKRNEMLEKVFFHDLMNRLGGFDGIIKIIKSENKQPELDEYIDLLNVIGELTIEDIQNQRILKAAENEDLILSIREHSAFEIIESVRMQLSFHPAANSKQIILCAECTDFIFRTDATLLKRILLNMAKNAAEATPDGGSVEIICRKEPDLAVFSVQNTGEIPNDIRLQIFQRSFSTKGPGRGLGTYSMKLFGENYLKGKVFFSSDNKNGTVFTIELPLNKE
jgi:signal transduction histidine kinase